MTGAPEGSTESGSEETKLLKFWIICSLSFKMSTFRLTRHKKSIIYIIVNKITYGTKNKNHLSYERRKILKGISFKQNSYIQINIPIVEKAIHDILYFV